MRAIRRFTVRPVLPEVLKPLGDLARNLRWCWNTDTQDLFRSVDPDLWESSGHDPVKLLSDVSVERLETLSSDKRFLKNLRVVQADLADYTSGDLWYAGFAADNPDAPAGIAYFSPEFGITEVLPQYSGGLGILAGDHLKTASDLGVPVIGVGLLYRQGYFRQSLNAAGWQQETYPLLDPNALPLTLLQDEDGPVTVEVGLGGGRVLAAQVWLAAVGRVPLLLLDSDVERNAGPERETTDRLYGGGTEHRLAQETLLGIGGIRAVRAYGKITGTPVPEVYHTNEGHAGFQGLERIRELLVAGVDFDTALETARAGTVFTTHTPVPAGIDRFPVDLVRHQFADFGLPLERVMALGSEDYDGGDGGVFNMAVMGFRLGQRANGVSLLHGEVSRDMFQGLWRAFDTSEVPITSITNGVHHLTWVHRDLLALLEAPSGSTSETVIDGYDWNGLAAVDDKTIWDLKRTMRKELIAFTRRRLAESSAHRGLGTDWVDGVLDPETITFGFARRVPSYKRLTLMLREPERLKALLTSKKRPIQIVIAGKSHPADEGGKALIQQLVQFADEHDVRNRIVFLPDYDIGMAKPLYPGCDVWLNNPLRPYEACGTSGMKAALNGAANLSILDGWWDEWYDPAFGWEIPSAEGVGSADQRDDLEARSLYEIIENEIVPRFYDRDSHGLPKRWIQMIRETVAGLGPKVLASRMVRDYVTHLYTPSAASSRSLASEAGGPEALAEWKRKVRDAWGDVVVDHVQSLDGDQVEVGTGIHVSATVRLGSLDPSDVEVQLVTGRVGSDDQLREPRITAFPAGVEVEGGPSTGSGGTLRRYEGTVQARRAGSIGYTVRVVPHHPLLVSTAEMGLAAVPSGVSSPPSA